MADENLNSRSQRSNSKKVKKSEQLKNKKLLVPFVGSIGLVTVVFAGGLIFFQSHFLPTTEANGVKIGWLNVEAAQEKLEKINTSGEIVVKSASGQEQKIQIPERYAISGEFLNKSLGSQSIKLPMNDSFKSELEAKLNELNFEEGTPSKDAHIERIDTGFQIIPEEQGTVVDKESLKNKIIEDVENNAESFEYNAADFYQKPAVLQNSEELQHQLTVLTQKENKKIILAISDKTVEIPKETLQSFINAEGVVDTGAIQAWLDGISQEYSARFQPVRFTNVHGETRQYTNNGSYGWVMNTAETAALINQAMESMNVEETVNAVIDGDINESSVVTQTYVEIDLNNQMMYFFQNGAKTVETSVITGRYHKGTATVPGFHTILYKDTNTSLKGQMLDGSKYDVPVNYWMPLLSMGGVVTQIGIHDADYKSEHFGNKEAYKTTFGSNGCINTPGAAVAQIFEGSYPGMPVFIYGNIYDDAPGEFDKPVDYGTPV